MALMKDGMSRDAARAGARARAQQVFGDSCCKPLAGAAGARRDSRTGGVLGAVAACLILTGCSGQLPPGYVRMDHAGDVRLRAVSANECVFTLRTESNPEGGDLAFWEKTITQRLTEVRGYVLVNRMELDNNSARGAQMVFDYHGDGVDYTYLIGLFVKGRSVHVFEAAGRRGQIQPDMAELTRTMQKWPL